MSSVDYQYFCTGCGLCHSECNINMEKSEKGFWRAQASSNEKFCESICPASGVAERYLYESEWGTVKEIHGAYAVDEEIRKKCSSGGVLTAAALYLLESGKIDGVIQTRAADKKIYAAITVCSTTREEVLSCCGSRYSVSTPLAEISSLVKNGKRYAVIGRPCDILSLRSYMETTGKYKEEIRYLLAFFCAGIPSDMANKRLLKEMGVREEECISLQYRGNGWPGYTTVEKKDGSSVTLEYKHAWGKYLGRDILPICRLCLDGTGVAADFSCGDYWQLTDDGVPDFGEHSGRNMILARTEKGEKLLEEMVRNQCIIRFPFKEGKEHIELIQPAQYNRVTTIHSQIAAMKLLGKKIPKYHSSITKRFVQKVDNKTRMKIFIGTLKRIWQGKI